MSRPQSLITVLTPLKAEKSNRKYGKKHANNNKARLEEGKKK
jgi:hypothetical protein